VGLGKVPANEDEIANSSENWEVGCQINRAISDELQKASALTDVMGYDHERVQSARVQHCVIREWGYIFVVVVSALESEARQSRSL
jgi:hypothetical protein